MSRIVIIGAGIIGLSIAYKLSLRGHKVIVVDKEGDVSRHQSGRNSGVLHCGISYQPGSLKAKLSREGYLQMINFCGTNSINFDVCGKLIVSKNKSEIHKLFEIGVENGINNIRILNRIDATKIEPNIADGFYLYIPEEGIVSFKEVCECLRTHIVKNNGEVLTNFRVKAIDSDRKFIEDKRKNREYYDLLINAAGIYSDNIAKMCGVKLSIRQIPFGGRYYRISNKFFNNLIYPCPDIDMPFLGIHMTRTVGGNYLIGPNAMIRLSKMNYTWRDFNFIEFINIFTYCGLWKFILRNRKFTLVQIREYISRRYFLREMKNLIAQEPADFEKSPLGIRAQAINTNGELVSDFVIKRNKEEVHILNAPSPGASASLAIADYIIKKYIL